MQPMTDGIDDQVRALVAARLKVPSNSITLDTNVEIEIPPPGDDYSDPLLKEVATLYGTIFQHPVESRLGVRLILNRLLLLPALGTLTALLWDLYALDSSFEWRLAQLAGFIILGLLWWLARAAPERTPKPFKRTITVRSLADSVRHGLM